MICRWLLVKIIDLVDGSYATHPLSDLRGIKLGKIYPFSNDYIMQLKRLAAGCGGTEIMIKKKFNQDEY